MLINDLFNDDACLVSREGRNIGSINPRFPSSRLPGWVFLLIIAIICLAACSTKEQNALPALPPGVVYPNSVTGHLPDKHQVELGRYLFYDRRLSFNQAKSCAGCHAPQFAFTDGYRRSFGATADIHQRNAQPLFNLAFLERLTAANPSFATPEQQMANPLFNTKFIELGVSGHEAEVLKRFRDSREYHELFAKAFPGKNDAVSIPHIVSAIAAFIKTIVSANSPYDRYAYYKEKNALDASARRGLQLFISDSLSCNSCHSGFNFSGGIRETAASVTERTYFNNGLYNTDGKGAYPAYDEGLKEYTRLPSDMGRFRVPTLRNLAFTGPYMHDGSMATLSEVIDMYARGGRLITQGADKGDGSKSPLKDARIKGFSITPQQKTDLLNFLLSLSDSGLINDPRYQNPFTGDETRKRYE